MPPPPRRPTPHQLGRFRPLGDFRPLPRRLPVSTIVIMARQHAESVQQNLSALGYNTPTHDTQRFAEIFRSVVVHARRFCNHFNATNPEIVDADIRLLYSEMKFALMGMFFNLFLYSVEHERYRTNGGQHGPPAA